jgi:hypothetical protein
LEKEKEDKTKMKKAMVILLGMLMIALPIFTACGQSLTESDIATIRGLITRVDNLESQVASVKSSVTNLGDTSAIKTDITNIKTDVEKLQADDSDNSALIASLETRIQALEDALAVDNTNTPTGTGEVTINFDEETPFYILSSATGPNQTSFKVIITNGTNEYRYVSYWVSLVCVSQDGIANVDTATLTMLSPIYGQSAYGFTTTLIPNDPTVVRQILFIPSATVPKIPVRGGETLKLYHNIDLKTISGIEEWEVTLTGTTISEEW